MKSLITSELFDKVLLDPVRQGATELHAVSGYASPSMVTKHMEALQAIAVQGQLSLDILVGMTGVDGLSEHSLRGFRSIPRQSSGARFNCAFTLPGKSVHSKVFVWSDESGPVSAWAGSANYTQLGFGLLRESTHYESLVEIEPDSALDYVLGLANNSVSYLHPDLADMIPIVPDVVFGEGSQVLLEADDTSNPGGGTFVLLPLIQTVGLLRGEVHEHSGLNWGQRPGRNGNQAYIPIPAKIRDMHYFPPRGVHFQVMTDDGETFIATVAQDGDKAIHTPADNGILGRYFRRRLGLPELVAVEKDDLEKFGSNGVEFVKIEDDLYRMNFLPGIKVI